MPTFDFQCPSGHVWERFVKKRDFVPKCEVCGEEGEKIYIPRNRRGGEGGNEYPKTTSDITGKPITLTSASHEAEVLKRHAEETGEVIRKRDDAAFLEKTYEGYDHRRGEQVYREGSGAGLPGSWSGGLPAGSEYMRKLQQERYPDEED